MHTKSKDEIKKFVEQELKEGKTYTYMLAAILGELIGAVERNSETLQWIIKENKLKPLLEKALQTEREKRPLLDEFEKELKRYLYGGYKPLEEKKTKKEKPYVDDIHRKTTFKRNKNKPFKSKLIRFMVLNFVVSLIIYFIGCAAGDKSLNFSFFLKTFFGMLILTGIYEIVRKILNFVMDKNKGFQ